MNKKVLPLSMTIEIAIPIDPEVVVTRFASHTERGIEAAPTALRAATARFTCDPNHKYQNRKPPRSSACGPFSIRSLWVHVWRALPSFVYFFPILFFFLLSFIPVIKVDLDNIIAFAYLVIVSISCAHSKTISLLAQIVFSFFLPSIALYAHILPPFFFFFFFFVFH